MATTSVPQLTSSQADLLRQHGSNFETGLTSQEASIRRTQLAVEGEGEEGLNTLDPPIKCPAWVCCLLPCIKWMPSMKLFRQVEPNDAEVLRDGRWTTYDAASLVRGDIIRLHEGDICPADATLLTVGGEDDDQLQSSSNDALGEEFVIDVRNVCGEAKPRTAASRGGKAVKPLQLFCGGHVLQGTGLAVVTATGSRTLLASLIASGQWPPKGDVSLAPVELIDMSTTNNDTDTDTTEREEGKQLLLNR